MDMNDQELIEKAAAFDGVAVEYAHIAKLFEDGKISLLAVIRLSSLAGIKLNQRLRLAEDRQANKANAEYDSLVVDIIDAAEVLTVTSEHYGTPCPSVLVKQEAYDNLMKAVRARQKVAGDLNEDAE